MNGRKEDVDRTDFFQIHSYIQYYASLESSEVILGGLLYPLDSPSDKHDWFSETLFGSSHCKTRFIVDGINLNDIPNNINDTQEISLLLNKRIEDMVKNWHFN